MSDEIKKTSPAPWLVGGAAVGGVGTWAGLTQVDKLKQYVTEPKYSSHEDILKESHDELVKQAKDAGEDTKGYLETAAEARKKIDGAEKAWEAEKADYIKNNTKTVKAGDTDEIKALEKQVDALKAEVANGEKQVTTKNTVTTRQTKAQALNKEIQTVEADLKAQKYTKNLIDEIAEKQKEIDSAKNRFVLGETYSAEYYKEYNKLTDRINELKVKKANGTIKEAEVNELKTLPARRANLKQKGLYSTTVQIPEQSAVLSHELREHKNSASSVKKALAKEQKGSQKYKELEYELNRINTKIEKIEKHIKDFADGEYTKQLNELIDTEARKISLASQNHDVQAQVRANAEKALKEKLDDVKGLTTEQKKGLLTRLNSELTERTIIMDDTIELERKLATVKNEYEQIPPNRRKLRIEREVTLDQKKVPVIERDIAQNEAKLAELNRAKELQKARRKHVKAQWDARKAARNSEATKTVDYITAEVGGLEAKVKITKESAPAYNHQNFVDTLSDADKKIYEKYNKMPKATTKVEEVATQALSKEQLDAKKLQINELTGQIAQKRAALPETVVESADDLAKKFEELKPKAKYIEEVETAAKNSIKDKFDDFAKKSGVTSNKKLWGFVAAGAVAVGLLAAAIRPKHKEQA